jgi:hypothetical protein
MMNIDKKDKVYSLIVSFQSMLFFSLWTYKDLKRREPCKSIELLLNLIVYYMYICNKNMFKSTGREGAVYREH